ncbi:hypothetical protein LZ30DRAFT_587353 [Colletotrichum cereale]|nr:hypothetical protein LZ30DRAFT_587353 [Colletotrichum cereale]
MLAYNTRTGRRLPRETRNIIYHLALVRGRTIIIKNRKECTVNSAPIAGSILRTCKTVHAEARGILYSQPILIGDRLDPVAWLRVIGPENRFYLRNVHLGSTIGFELLPKDYQAMSWKVATLLTDAPSLKSLEIRAMRIPDINWDLHKDQNGQMKQRPWYIAAQHIAKLIYDEYRPVFSKALSRGQTPQQLCSFVKAHRNLFLGYSDVGWSLGPSVLALSLSATEIAWAEEEVVGHIKLLLERNLYYRRHPRFKRKPEPV